MLLYQVSSGHSSLSPTQRKHEHRCQRKQNSLYQMLLLFQFIVCFSVFTSFIQFITKQCIYINVIYSKHRSMFISDVTCFVIIVKQVMINKRKTHVARQSALSTGVQIQVYCQDLVISRAECFTLIAVYWRVTGVDYVNMKVKLQYTFISISYTIICVIYYDSTDIVKLFSSHYKLTI